MTFNKTKRKLIILLTTLLISLGLVSPANAETIFYSNILRSVQNTITYFAVGPTEYADDVPFSGSHLVSSFRFGYRSPDPVHATFRFYGVDPATGFPGQLIAQFGRDLPPADIYLTSTITLAENEQFTFTAEPGLFGGSISGGWFSVQYESATGVRLPYLLAAQLARGSSKNGLYDVVSDTVITVLDASAVIPVSFYLELSGIQAADGGTTTDSKLTNIGLMPTSVVIGASSTATVSLSSPAPAGGLEVRFSTDKKKGVYFSSSKILVKEGSTSAVVTIFTTKRALNKRASKTVATIIAKDKNGNSAEASLMITR